jgi:hypothetical protein
MKKILLLLGMLISLTHCYGQHTNTSHSNLKDVQLVTNDIPRFWTAFDSCKTSPQNSIAIYDALYFGPGSAGLKAFKTVSLKTTENFVTAIKKYSLYYESIRENTLHVERIIPAIRQSLIMFEDLYPPAAFPNVYFLIGDLNAGGKSEKDGLLIGTELYSSDDKSNFTSVYPPFVKALKTLKLSDLHKTVIHELVHYQQHYPDNNTVLAYAIKEGSADFISELVTGKSNKNGLSYQYGNKHEKELWIKFEKDINSTDINKWFYNAATDDVPSDLGYYIGYKIVQAYYFRSNDRKKAFGEILNIQDFNLFLKESKYGDGLK